MHIAVFVSASPRRTAGRETCGSGSNPPSRIASTLKDSWIIMPSCAATSQRRSRAQPKTGSAIRRFYAPRRGSRAILITTPQTIYAAVVTDFAKLFSEQYFTCGIHENRSREYPKQAPAEAISGSESFGCLL